MRSVPTHIDEDHLAEVIGREWGLTGRLEYRPVGAGAYHWDLCARSGLRHFVTCDDLDTKPWLGPDRETVMAGLSGVYRTACEIERSGASFVIAPLVAHSGDPVVRLDARTTVAVFPFVSGTSGRWGDPVGASVRRRVVRLLAELHRTASPSFEAPSDDFELPGRAELENALGQLDVRWDHGPLAEPARRELAPAALRVRAWLDDLHRLGSKVRTGSDERVLTHGEPHPENLVWTADGPVLVDWDRVAMARPERDLWMLDDGTGSCSQLYVRLTGRAPDPTAMRAYRLLWALTDLAAFTSELRRPHAENADATKALNGIRLLLGGREPAPYG